MESWSNRWLTSSLAAEPGNLAQHWLRLRRVSGTANAYMCCRTKSDTAQGHSYANERFATICHDPLFGLQVLEEPAFIRSNQQAACLFQSFSCVVFHFSVRKLLVLNHRLTYSDIPGI